jgi:3-dehydroquinate synthase
MKKVGGIQFIDNISKIAESIKDASLNRRVFIITDENVHAHCLSRLLPYLPATFASELIELEPGETSKTQEIANHIYEHLLECEADRNDLIINIGGGVITDLGGFVASTYKRGISFIHIPTSLMAMTDAAIGGKNGLDLGSAKNVIGTFSHPTYIYICPEFLTTLPKIEMMSGFAEMLKHGLVKDKHLWDSLVELAHPDAESLQKYIALSAGIKHTIVERDFLEVGERKLLNFGHTIGHAIESVQLEKGISITHGQAIAAGMIIETTISEELGLTNAQHRSEIITAISKFYPKLDWLPSFEKLKQYLRNDKKNKAGECRFSLVKAPGESIYDVPVSLEVIERVYNRFI